MNGGKVIYHFEADDSDLKKATLSVGDLVKGNLISSAVTKGLSTVWTGIKNISSAIGGLAIQGGFDRAMNIENAEFKLKGLGHSAEEVEEIMDNALKSVKGTAYGLDDAATVAASAVAAGVKPGQDLERTLKLVGDAAAISGRDMISMGAIFNKVAAAGKMTGEELNQLTDAGIPMLQLLADNLGLTTEEVRDLVSAGEIGFDEFRDAIEKGMGGAALTMGQTFSGALANTKAAMSRLGKTFMDPFLKGMTPALGTLTEIIDMVAEGTTEGLEEKAQLLGEQLIEMVNNVMETLIPLIENAVPVISQTLKTLIGQIPAILETLLPQVIDIAVDIIDAIADILPSLIEVITKGLIKAIEGIAKVLPNIIDGLMKGFVALINALADEAPTLIPILVQSILDSLLAILDNIDIIIDAGIQLLIGLIQGLIQALPILIEKLPEIIIALSNAIIDNLPKLLELGITILVAIAQGLVEATPKIIEKIPEIMTKLVQAIKNYYSKLFQLGKILLGKIINGISSAISGIWEVGKNLVQGLWDSISNSLQWIKNKIKGWVGNVLSFVKSLFGIHSPSTEFAFIGKMNMIGFENGMESMKGQVQDTIDSVFDLQPTISGQMQSAYSPEFNVNVINNLETDPLGQLVNSVKTFSGGAKNDYNWGSGL